MSLLANHGLIQGIRLTPSFITYNAGVVNSTNYPASTGLTPTAGSLMIITAGGTENRTVVSGPTSAGFTQLASVSGGSAGTQYIWYKIATGSEGTSFPIVWNLTLNGGWDFIEFRDVDPNNPLAFQIGNFVTLGTSVVLPTYNAPMPGVAFTCVSKSFTASWLADNAFTDLGGAGQHKHAFKYYNQVTLSEVTTWSGSIETVIADLLFFRGKQT